MTQTVKDYMGQMVSAEVEAQLKEIQKREAKDMVLGQHKAKSEADQTERTDVSLV